MASLSDFHDLLEEYFATKNAPETEQGDKKSKLDDVKMKIYDSYLNEDFGDERERPPNVSKAESKVMKEFFMEANKFEEEYMGSARFTNAELGNISNGLALQCAVEFTQHLEPERRHVLLKSEINAQLSRVSKKKRSKKRKTKKRKRKSKRVKSKKVKTKRKSKNQKGGEPFLITLGVATALGLPGAFLGEAVKDGFEDHTELKTNAGKYISILSKILLDDQLKKLKDLKKQKDQLTTSEPEPEPAVASPRSEVPEGIPPTRSSLQSKPELNDIDQEILQLQTHVFQLIMSLQTKERVIAILKNVEPQIFTIEDTISDSELNTLLSEYIGSRELSGVIDFYDRIIEYVFNTLDIENLEEIFRRETEDYKNWGRSLDITTLLSEWGPEKVHTLKEKYGDEITRNIVKLLAIIESPNLQPRQRRQAIDYLVEHPAFEIPAEAAGTPLISYELYKEI